MTRLLYTFAVVLAMPWALLHLLWRSRRQPGYRQHWRERFGFYAGRPEAPLIWVHAVSVGETRAAQPLLAALRERYPDHRILLTHMTPTGRQTSTALFGDSVMRAYLPYDLPGAAQRFLEHFRPVLGLIVETELWPNLIAACRCRRTPLLLVNARLSARSARGYAKVPALARQALQSLTAIAAQGDDDALRLRSLGATDVAVLGNMKFDVAPPPDQIALGQAFRARIGRRQVFLCASTREGEEALILDAWQRGGDPAVLLTIVPRHPQRFDDVAALIAARNLKMQRRSDERAVDGDTQVWLGDSMGEMFGYYAAADVAFVGGSLLDYGCQNLIEPCAVGVPVLIGPSTFNFADAAAAALEHTAATGITNAGELIAKALALVGDPVRRAAAGKAAAGFAARHRGATARTLALIETRLPAQADSTRTEN
jgi:3-deoxy-D-manno-octulosonic-acid transferase